MIRAIGNYNKGDFEFLFRVPPDNTPIDIEKVVTFAENVLSLKGISESMRSYAEKYLDWKVKMAQL